MNAQEVIKKIEQAKKDAAEIRLCYPDIQSISFAFNHIDPDVHDEISKQLDRTDSGKHICLSDENGFYHIVAQPVETEISIEDIF